MRYLSQMDDAFMVRGCRCSEKHWPARFSDDCLGLWGTPNCRRSRAGTPLTLLRTPCQYRAPHLGNGIMKVFSGGGGTPKRIGLNGVPPAKIRPGHFSPDPFFFSRANRGQNIAEDGDLLRTQSSAAYGRGHPSAKSNPSHSSPQVTGLQGDNGDFPFSSLLRFCGARPGPLK